MKRREFCKTLVSVASLSAVPGLIRADQPAKTISTGSTSVTPTTESVSQKKLLFFDLWKLDAWDNVELVQGVPEFVDEATYVDDSIPGKGAGKPSVYYDGQAGVWRMLYNIGWSPIRLMAAVSDDGLHWRPDPHPEIAVPEETAGGKQAEHHLFEIEFQNAELYSLSAAWHFLDAQDQWMLKDGQPIDTSRFDF